MPGRRASTVVYQAAQSEGDQLGQLSIAENLISQGFDALLLSPQTDNNLQPALESAEAQGHTGGQRQRRRHSRRQALCRQRPARQRRAGGQMVPREPARRRQGRGDRGPGGRLRRRPAHRRASPRRSRKAASSPSSPASPATGTGRWPTTRPRRSSSRIPISSASTPTMTAWPSASWRQ